MKIQYIQINNMSTSIAFTRRPVLERYIRSVCFSIPTATGRVSRITSGKQFQNQIAKSQIGTRRLCSLARCILSLEPQLSIIIGHHTVNQGEDTLRYLICYVFGYILLAIRDVEKFREILIAIVNSPDLQLISRDSDELRHINILHNNINVTLYYIIESLIVTRKLV